MRNHMFVLLTLVCMLSTASAHGVGPAPAGAMSQAGSALPIRDRGQPGFDPNEVVHRIRGVRSAGAVPSGSGEFLIDTNITYGPAASDQSLPVLAFDGTDYLVVWNDYRSDSDHDICGARVTSDGTVLDRSAITISTATSDQGAPAVAFDGANFLVTWNDYRNGSWDIYGARVTTGGALLDPSGFPISAGASSGLSPAVAYDGTNSLVVWSDNRGGSGYAGIYGARVTPEGRVLDTAGIVISATANQLSDPAVGFDGTSFLVAWTLLRNDLSHDIYGARVTPDGEVLDTSGIPISTAEGNQELPTLAFGGTSFLVLWMDNRNGPDFDIYGARVTQDGVVLDTAGIPISTAGGYEGSPALSFNGVNFLATWTDQRSGVDIYGARVSPAGIVLDTSGIPIAATARYAVPAFGGTNFLVAWEDWGSGSGYSEVYCARVTPEGMVLDTSGTLVSSAITRQWSPALAFDGTDYFVTWSEPRIGSGYDLYGARVTLDGAVLDPSAISISSAPADQWFPSVSSDGTNFLVTWMDDRLWNICGARVTSEGNVLDTAGITISPAPAGYPAVAFDGANFLVVWEGERDTSGYSDIYGARVTPGGMVLDPSGIPISTAAYSQVAPALAFDGANCLVVWSDQRNLDCDIYGARVTPEGTVLDTSGIPITTAAHRQICPDIVFGGGNYLVTWADYRSGASYANVHAARVTTGGKVLDTSGIPIEVAANNQAYPGPAFDGTNYIVMWQDNRSGSYDIYGARVTPAGMVLDHGPVVCQEGDQSNPKICCNGNQKLLVYAGWAGTVGRTTYNTQRIWGRVNPEVGVAESKQPTAHNRQPMATILRGVLRLEPAAVSSQPSAALLDITGRKVLSLKPGPNDVSRLAPGVYFVRSAASGEPPAVEIRKVVLTR